MARPRKTIQPTLNGSPANLELETQQRIVKAAQKLFSSKGFKGVSMKDVAEEIAVTPAALYYHFPKGKTDLFIAVVKNMFAEWAAGVPIALADAENIRERLKKLTTYLLQQPSEQLPMVMRDINEHIQNEEEKRLVWVSYLNTYTRAISNVFQDAADKGEITSSIPATNLAAMFQGMNIALMRGPHFAACRDNPIEAERMASMVVSVLLDGIGLP